MDIGFQVFLVVIVTGTIFTILVPKKFKVHLQKRLQDYTS